MNNWQTHLNGNMVLRVGAQMASLDEVANVPLPAATDTFCPVPHIALYEQAFHQLQSAGMKIKQEVHALNSKRDVFGANYFAVLEVESDRPDYNLIIGLRNSHIQQYAASFVLGSKVFVCDNLAFSGEVKLSRKHTRHVERDLPAVMQRAVYALSAKRVSQDERIAAYKGRVIDTATADHALMNMARARVLAPNKLIPAAGQFDKPAFVEHLNDEGDRTVWTLFNAVTEVYKGSSVFEMPRRGQALHGVCDTLVGLGLGSHGKELREAAAMGEVELEGFEALAA